MGTPHEIRWKSAATMPFVPGIQGDRIGPRSASHGLKDLLGPAAWLRLPAAIQARFNATAEVVEYTGKFEVVRASRLGLMIASVCKLFGTPIAPHLGTGVAAVVRVQPTARGVEWRREYHWADRTASVVVSTKVIEPNGTLVEELPAGLSMSLNVYEAAAALHFVSLRYYFQLSLPWVARCRRIALPRWLSPGTTHVEHADLANGWFRFTMTVTHPIFGELFFQTGCFHSAGD